MPIPEFIARLREKIGHDLLWLPGATAVVLDAERVLLVRRADDGRWTPVTGIVDPGEHPAAAARREVLEETGVTCHIEKLVAVAVSEPVVYDNGDRAQYLDHTFRCRYVDGDAHVADDESVDVGWFDLDDLPVMDSWHLGRVRAAVDHDGEIRLPEA